MTPKNGGLLSMALSYCGFVGLSVRAVMLKGVCSPVRRTHQHSGGANLPGSL